MKSPAFLLAALLLAPGAALLAQTAPAPAPTSASTPAPGPQVSVTFTILSYGNAGPAASFQSGGRYTAVKLTNGKRSPEYKYTGPASLMFYASSSVSGADAKPAPVGAAALPTKGTKLLLVFVSGGDGYTIGVLPDDAGAIPPGKARIYNASTGPVSVNYNFTNEVVMKPGESKVVDADKGQIAVQVSVPNPDDATQWMKQTNNGWPLPANQRREIFILGGAAFKGMDIAQRAVQMFSPDPVVPATPATAAGARGANGARSTSGS